MERGEWSPRLISFVSAVHVRRRVYVRVCSCMRGSACAVSDVFPSVDGWLNVCGWVCACFYGCFLAFLEFGR